MIGNVGGWEVMVILLLALIVLGPSRLPDAARQVGKAMAEVRKLSTGFQQEVRSAFEEADPRTIVTKAVTETTAVEEPKPAPPAVAKKAAPRRRSEPLRAPGRGT